MWPLFILLLMRIREMWMMVWGRGVQVLLPVLLVHGSHIPLAPFFG